MKAVWGKMDPFKRINTFEVRNHSLTFILGIWFRFYV
jgi:hypothetical protein